jgi:hypothetical protein
MRNWHPVRACTTPSASGLPASTRRFIIKKQTKEEHHEGTQFTTGTEEDPGGTNCPPPRQDLCH